MFNEFTQRRINAHITKKPNKCFDASGNMLERIRFVEKLTHAMDALF
jgi:hypothetical protein